MNATNMAPGRLAENIAHFARVLRRAGLPVGPGRVLAAIEAAHWVDLGSREDFRTALEATLLGRADQRALFDQAFALFWRDPKLLERAMHRLLPKAAGTLDRNEEDKPGNRLQEALHPRRAKGEDAETEEIELDAAFTLSAHEVLQRKDFETMTAEELAQAKRMLQSLHLPLPAIRTRRYARDRAGASIDLRATLRKSMRAGGEWFALERRRHLTRPSTLVVLADISGSMSRYSRMLLHFLHAVAQKHPRVHVFTFGTRLTNITRMLRHKDVDQALAEVGRAVPDWSGGTRIGTSIEMFNKHWSRRLLGQGATVLILSDGLDGGEGVELGAQMQRLRASCRRIVWLNPLLRYVGFEPRAAGIRAMLPYVDRFRPAHNVASLKDLADVLADLSQMRPLALHSRNRSTEYARWK